MNIQQIVEQLAKLQEKLEQNYAFLHDGNVWLEKDAEDFKKYIVDNTIPEMEDKLYITDIGITKRLTLLAPPNLHKGNVAGTNNCMEPERTATNNWHRKHRMQSIWAATVAIKFQDVTYVTSNSLMGLGENQGAATLSSGARVSGCQINSYDINMHGWMRTLKVFKAWHEAGVIISKEDFVKGKLRHAQIWKEVNTYNDKAEVGTGIKKLIDYKQWAESPLEIISEFEDLIENKLENNLTARTWGWEVEVPDAKDVAAPRGVEKGSDGSLRSYESSDNCECDCNSCYYHECDCEHCESGSSDPDHDCGSSECSQADMAEFRTTGGIQRIVHSALNKLCADLNENDAEKNDTAGTHIHVWAGDLDAKQVATVMATYRIMQPMFNAIAGRANVNYSRYVDPDMIGKALKGTLVAHKTIDVNISHLRMQNERKTIEFRQMDCNLNAARINGWAWMLRGLVTAVKRGMQISDVVKINKLQQYVELLAKYHVTPTNEAPEELVYGSSADMHELAEAGHIKQLQLA
jgi:hypothetical protein